MSKRVSVSYYNTNCKLSLTQHCFHKQSFYKTISFSDQLVEMQVSSEGKHSAYMRLCRRMTVNVF